jgi:hypothetical protein
MYKLFSTAKLGLKKIWVPDRNHNALEKSLNIGTLIRV